MLRFEVTRQRAVNAQLRITINPTLHYLLWRGSQPGATVC